jgi:hypothetical protein
MPDDHDPAEPDEVHGVGASAEGALAPLAF